MEDLKKEGTIAYEVCWCCNNFDCLAYSPLGYGDIYKKLNEAKRGGNPGCRQCGSDATASIHQVIFKDGRWEFYHPETYDSFKEKFLKECWGLNRHPQVYNIEFDHGRTVVTYACEVTLVEWGFYPQKVFWGNPKDVMEEVNRYL